MSVLKAPISSTQNKREKWYCLVKLTQTCESLLKILSDVAGAFKEELPGKQTLAEMTKAKPGELASCGENLLTSLGQQTIESL